MKIGIYGYGNLGRGVECAAMEAPDTEIVGIFTRRDTQSVNPHGKIMVYPADTAANFADKIDVMVICGGSATDLPEMTPRLAEKFNVVDSFDTHAKIPEHFENVDVAAQKSGKIAVISAGWDPGMFSVNRVYANAFLPESESYTFWGKGVSQGHSDAIRRIDGVKDARQYTVPVNAALDAVRGGTNPILTTRERHTRLCYVVPEAGADLARIEREIKTMPNYFADYDTTVHFISQDELDKNHSALPHGGFVIHSAKTGFENEHNNVIEYRLKLDSNPEFTACVLLAAARAAYRMNRRGMCGAKTMLDIAPADLSLLSADELRKKLL